MNRRNFLKIVGVSTVSIPALGVLAKSNVNKDMFEIMSPHEIAKHWMYVNKPVFVENDKTYIVKSLKLQLCADYDALSGKVKIHKLIQPLAKIEINERKLTHVHSVRFFECPIIDPQTSIPYYCAYVRGAKVVT